MRSQLKEGDFYAAQKLSFEAILATHTLRERQLSRPQDFQKLAYLLAPSKITVDREPPSIDIRANQNWIKQNRMQYRGR